MMATGQLTKGSCVGNEGVRGKGGSIERKSR